MRSCFACRRSCCHSRPWSSVEGTRYRTGMWCGYSVLEGIEAGSGENKMPYGCRSSATIVVLIGLGLLQPMEAQAFELTGAWASQPDLCKLVFTKKSNQVAFAELSDLYGSGFIVDGSRIRGKSARCTIKSKKQEGDGLELS